MRSAVRICELPLRPCKHCSSCSFFDFFIIAQECKDAAACSMHLMIAAVSHLYIVVCDAVQKSESLPTNSASDAVSFLISSCWCISPE